MINKTAPSHTVRIHIGGDYAAAVAACRKFTMRGLCVSITRSEFVYTMGAESGVCVTLINYPRFPKTADEIDAGAAELGHYLCAELCQGSFTVEGPSKTRWYSRRPQDGSE